MRVFRVAGAIRPNPVNQKKNTLDAPAHQGVSWHHTLPFLPTLSHFEIGLNLVGLYEHQMDEKGRVSLPSAFRREADGDRFVLLQFETPCLTLFPIAKWEEVQQRLLDYRRTNPEGWNQVRLILSRTTEVSPDKQGRILIPAALQEGAGLSGTVLLSGNMDRVELWNPDTFKSVVERSQQGDLAQHSHRLFS